MKGSGHGRKDTLDAVRRESFSLPDARFHARRRRAPRLHCGVVTPLEPGVEENKFYAPNIGLIVEEEPETGERLELLEFDGVGS